MNGNFIFLLNDLPLGWLARKLALILLILCKFMSSTANLIRHLHVLIYEQTGWALPDDLLRELALLVPTPLTAQVGEHQRAQLRRWVIRERATILARTHQLQGSAVMYG